MHLYGIVGGCWAVVAYREITVPPPFFIEFMVYNATEDLYGCHPYRGSLELKSGTNWWDCGRMLMMFYEDGRIQLGDPVGWSYNELEWIQVRMLYSRQTDTTVHMVYWINDQLLYEVDVSNIPCEDQLAYLGVASQEGTVWFDDVQVLVNTHPDSFSLLSPLDLDSVKTPVTLIWQKATDPDPNDTVHYDLYLSRSIVFNLDSTIVYDSLPDTTFTDSLDIKLWYWKVKAYDRWGAVRWSDQTWSFYVYLCGDDNGDGKVTVSEVVYEINFLFKGGPAPTPFKAGDVNCDGYETVSDVVYKVNYLFKGGPKPCQGCP